MTRRLLPLALGAAAGLLALVVSLPPAARPIAACPDGARVTGDAPPRGAQQWCERVFGGGPPARHGPYRAWHANGRIKVDGAYADGLKVGRWTFWHANGRRQEEGEFRADREEGVWARWYESGHPLDAGGYRDGARWGRWTRWHPNGEKAEEGEYAAGAETGARARWSIKGEPCDTPPAHG